MVLIGVIIVLTLLAGIIFLTSNTSSKKTREEVLKDLAHLLEGNLEVSPHKENFYRLTFIFEGHPFVYEDWEDRGFNQKRFKAFLRGRINKNLTLYFTERENKKVEMRIPNNSSDFDEKGKPHMPKVNLPRVLEKFYAHTNSPFLVNKLMEDPQVVKLFTQFKNMDERGQPFMSLNIIDGSVNLEFAPSKVVKPNLPDLYQNINSIEDYLAKIIFLANKINTLTEK